MLRTIPQKSLNQLLYSKCVPKEMCQNNNPIQTQTQTTILKTEILRLQDLVVYLKLLFM